MIAFQQVGCQLDGFVKYVLSNLDTFRDEEELLAKLRATVKARKWEPTYSRNLVIEEHEFTNPFYYRDHTGTYNVRVYQVWVRNMRPDEAAVNAICILDYIEGPNGRTDSPDRAHIKWTGQGGYSRTILPMDHSAIDLFSVHADLPGLFLHSARDTPRAAIVSDNGKYQLFYKLYAEGFPMVEFSIDVELAWKAPDPGTWDEGSTANLVEDC